MGTRCPSGIRTGGYGEPWSPGGPLPLGPTYMASAVGTAPAREPLQTGPEDDDDAAIASALPARLPSECSSSQGICTETF